MVFLIKFLLNMPPYYAIFDFGSGGLNREGGVFIAYHPIPPVMDCFPVSVGRGWGSRSPLNTTEYIAYRST